MTKAKKVWYRKLFFILFLPFFYGWVMGENSGIGLFSINATREKVKEMMAAGNIPGLSLVIIHGEESRIESFGYADLEKRAAVTPATRFEIGSCSKAFTALAVLRLVEKGQLRLDDPVSKYIPGFSLEYQGRAYPVTLSQLLHHTSGIPWRSISLIPVDDSPGALQQTVRNLAGTSLDTPPGKQYHYATINYDILGAVIEKVTGQSYEKYMEQEVLAPLGLTAVRVGQDPSDPLKAVGYKIGFGKPRRYQSPVFRGNNPAAYIVADANHIARWLRLQLGLIPDAMTSLITQTHVHDQTVPPDIQNLSSYAMGWEVSLKGDQEIFHRGANPNFTAFMALRPQEKIAVAVLANSNSFYTQEIGDTVMKFLSGEELPPVKPFSDKIDTACTMIALILGFYLLLNLVLVGINIVGFFRGRNKFEPFTWKKAGKLLGVIVVISPYLLGLYLLPTAVVMVPWTAVLVWGPASTYAAVILAVAAFGISIIRFIVSLLLPNKNRYLNAIPMLILLGMATGLSNTAVLFLITTSFYSNVRLGYLLFYFALAFLLFVVGTKVVSARMIKMTNRIILDMRTELIDKLVAANNQNFEKLEDGRIFTTLNDDTAVIANSANMLIGTISNLITGISAFVYLMTISFKATLVVLLVVLILSFYYYFISKISRRYLEQARDTQNVFMGLLNGLIQGFKELSLHFRKKKEYREDLLESCRLYCRSSITASMKFLNSSIIGNSFIMIVLGTLSLVVPRVLTGVNTLALISYIMVLLYLIGPINMLLGLIPGITRLKVSWDRIKEFNRLLADQVAPDTVRQMIKKLNAPDSERNVNLQWIDNTRGKRVIDSIKAEGVIFRYEKLTPNDQDFSIGPIDLEIKRGQALFIIGGNGSGKTTLAKLLTGLYVPQQGTVKINGQEIETSQAGEYYSTVFSDYHLFRKIYEVDLREKAAEVQKYLRLLELDKKVQLNGSEYSTIQLSSGQRKRLALMQCFLEDRPIYLFDEFAANMDPEFRRFFYRELLVQLKAEGKIIIAITHDDHYFDVADKIIKLDMGAVDTKDRNPDIL